ncbi:uncharacterized protein C24H6.02c [Cephus cinctus]|uniref:Uncharacterized protein C24H6.02c n=1 Tax=Cephus cinctus TaxID=211228 RepID=A0AAJ7FMA8_CEPCN|nr:uncharacterized protein C24H6.02c [Cephus cinctus]
MSWLQRALRLGVRMSVCKSQQNFTNHIQNVQQILNNKFYATSEIQRRVFSDTNPKSEEDTTNNEPASKKAIGKLEVKLHLSFVCKRCKSRNNKIISRLAYTNGIVIVRCDGCKNNHLIADNLGWFGHTEGKMNIENILAKKGEKVRKVQNDYEGYFEIVTEELLSKIKEQQRQEMEREIIDKADDLPKLEDEQINVKKDSIPQSNDDNKKIIV